MILFKSNQPVTHRIDMYQHLGEKHLSKLKFFDHLSLETKGVIALKLYSISCPQGKHIFRVSLDMSEYILFIFNFDKFITF